MYDIESLLREGARSLGVDLTGDEIHAFISYLHELRRWNRRVNLTSIEDEREIVIRHFLDSLTPLEVLGKAWKVLDVGSGAGFPGIPLKIVRPDLSVVLIDSSKKKVAFERHIIRTLRLEGIEAIHGRVEGLACTMPRVFDAVISRAFSRVAMLASLSAPLLKPGGFLVAMKGPRWKEELEGVQIEGFEILSVCEKVLPFSDIRRYLVIFRRCFT